jgi:very-short-patch-repair endonuclease
VQTTDQIELLLRTSGGVVARADHPELATAMAWMVRSGRLNALLPGVYTSPGATSDPVLLMRAIVRRHPDAVLVRAAAARVSFWPAAPMNLIEVAIPVRVLSRPGYRFTRRIIPPELIVERAGLRYSCPSLTAIDLATFTCTDAIDVALRTRAATLAGMYEALRLTPHRTRNPERRRLLIDSRTEPWSAAERLGHQILRRAGIRGWHSNVPVRLEGRLYFLDIAFDKLKLAIEIDGRLHETDSGIFEADRWRQNALMQDGWTVLRFTWAMLSEHPDTFVSAVRQAIALKK